MWIRNPATNCGERHCIIPADHQEERGGPQRLRLDVSATRLPSGLETTLHVSRTGYSSSGQVAATQCCGFGRTRNFSDWSDPYVISSVDPSYGSKTGSAVFDVKKLTVFHLKVSISSLFVYIFPQRNLEKLTKSC
jgi:hypothetical protein